MTYNKVKEVKAVNKIYTHKQTNAIRKFYAKLFLSKWPGFFLPCNSFLLVCLEIGGRVRA